MIRKRKPVFVVGDLFAIPCSGGFGLGRLALSVAEEDNWRLAGDWLEVLPRVFEKIPNDPCAEFDSSRITGWFEHGTCSLWIEFGDAQKIGHCVAPILNAGEFGAKSTPTWLMDGTPDRPWEVVVGSHVTTYEVLPEEFDSLPDRSFKSGASLGPRIASGWSPSTVSATAEY